MNLLAHAPLAASAGGHEVLCSFACARPLRLDPVLWRDDVQDHVRLPGCAPCCICLLRPHWCVAVVTSWEGRGRACPPLHWVRRGYDEAVRRTVPDGIPCGMGYRAGWDNVPGGIPCRVGCRAGWDTVPGGIPCRMGEQVFDREANCDCYGVLQLRYVMGFFVPCVWLVPFGFFVSLSVNESVLPSTDSMKPAKPAGVVLCAVHALSVAHDRRPRTTRTATGATCVPCVACPRALRALDRCAPHRLSRQPIQRAAFGLLSQEEHRTPCTAMCHRLRRS